MSYSKKDIRLKFQQVITGFETSTKTLDGTTVSEIVELSCPASKVTVQSTGNLVFNFLVSANGVDFVSATAGVAANVLNTYSTNLIASVKIERVSGTGRVSILGIS